MSIFTGVTYHFGLSLWYDDRSSLAFVAQEICGHSSVVMCENTAEINLCDYCLASVNMAAVQSHVSTGSTAPDRPTGETSDVGPERLAWFLLLFFNVCFVFVFFYNFISEFPYFLRNELSSITHTMDVVLENRQNN